MHFLNRREFLQDSAALAAGLAGASTWGGTLSATEQEANKKVGANDTLRVAVIGVRGRGQSHVVDGFANRNGCIVATICDVDEAVIGKAMTQAEKLQGKAPKFEQDLRRIMEDKSIDIVSIATPNHWHALAAIWAMQAGKDVYLEKPVSHNVSEGRRVVEAARKYNRICQAGMQSRSMPGMRDAIAYLHSGELGKVSLARGLCYKRRNSIGKVSGEQPVPATVNYDLWCGPAPKNPLMRKNLHYDWHWFWDYGNGDIGNQGPHEFDKARWGLNKNELPKSVISVGGRFGYVDDGQTANTQICLYDYGDCQLIFEVRGLPATDPYPPKVLKKGSEETNFIGNIFYGTKGMLVCPSNTTGFVLNPAGEIIKQFSGGEEKNHYTNFIKAVRSRQAADLFADVLEGHLSHALCHLGNISHRLGTLEPFSKKRQAFGDDKEAYETLARMQDHLRENKVPLEQTSYSLGRKLILDPKTERFADDTEANLLLTREYRKGFEVPAKV